MDQARPDRDNPAVPKDHQIGLRRTFRTQGLVLAGPRELRTHLMLVGDVRADVYVGTNPPGGVWRRTGGGTASPGEQFESGVQFADGLTNADGELEVLLEVVCYGPRPRAGEVRDRPATLDSIEESRELQWAVDYVTGMLSLLHGPQLAFELVDERALRVVDGEAQEIVEFATIYYMSDLPLESLDLLAQCKRRSAGNRSDALDERGVALALHWWQKGLRERDPIDRFFYFYVAMECILGLAPRASGVVRGRRGIQRRFSAFAEASQLVDAERDTRLFQDICDVRNALVHEGRYQPLVAEPALRELVGPFEDLVQRCLKHIVHL